MLEELSEAEPDQRLRDGARRRLPIARDRNRAMHALQAEIDALKRTPEYRQHLDRRISGDSQTWEYFAAAHPDAVIVEVERLEARLRHL